MQIDDCIEQSQFAQYYTLQELAFWHTVILYAAPTIIEESLWIQIKNKTCNLIKHLTHEIVMIISLVKLSE